MRFLLLVACLPLAQLASQAPRYAIPRGWETREGDTRHWVPSHVAPSRAQSTYRNSLILVPTGNIQRLSLRPDSASTTFSSHTWLLTIHLSSAGVKDPDHLSHLSYAANQGTDRTRVLNQQPVSFPGHTITVTTPQAWRVSIPIQPFAYTAGRNLQIEWDVDDPAPNPGSIPWFVDAQAFTQPSSGGYFTRDRITNACPSSGTDYGGEAGGPGSTAAVWFYSGSAPSLPAVFAMGTTDQSWGGTPLPYDLAALGFAGCKVYCDQTLTVGGQTDSIFGQGRFRVDMLVPNIAALSGTDWYTQNFVLDPSFGHGLRASDKGRIRIGNIVPPSEAKHLYSYQGPITDQPEFNAGIGVLVGIN